MREAGRRKRVIGLAEHVFHMQACKQDARRFPRSQNMEGREKNKRALAVVRTCWGRALTVPEARRRCLIRCIPPLTFTSLHLEDDRSLYGLPSILPSSSPILRSAARPFAGSCDGSRARDNPLRQALDYWFTRSKTHTTKHDFLPREISSVRRRPIRQS